MRAGGRTESDIKRGVVHYYKALIAYFPDVRAVTQDSILEYVKHRRAQGIRGQTIAKELVCLKRGFALARIQGPAHWVKVDRDEADARRASKGHTRKAWQGFLMGLEGEAWDVMAFALLTGLRHQEIYRARSEDILETEDGFVALRVREKVKRKTGARRQVVLGPMARAIAARLPFKEQHRKIFATACRGNPTGNMTLRDARAAFATAGDRAGDSRATDRAMGHHGVPARYQKTDYERLAAVSLAVETWLLTHAAELVERPPARRLTLDMTTRLWSVDS